jgi:hypothetical protein
MFNTTTIEPYIAQPTTTPFRWGWDFNHWVPWMLHYPLHPPRKTRRMLQLKLTKPPRFIERIQHIHQQVQDILQKSNAKYKQHHDQHRCHTSFRWETKFGCTCRKNALQGLIGSFVHSVMDLTPSPRLWVTILLSSTFPPSLACTQCSMWTSFGPIFHHYWTPRR